MKEMTFRFLIFFVTVVFIDASCQEKTESSLTKTSEQIVQVTGLEGCSFVGYDSASFPLFQKPSVLENSKLNFLVLDEHKSNLLAFDVRFQSPVKESNWTTGFLDIICHRNEIWLYTLGYMNDTYSIYYKNLWAQYRGKNILLDSVYNADKKIHISISSDNKYLIVNTLNTLSDYYNEKQDNRFVLYSLDNLKKGIVTKQFISCQYCSDGYIIGDKMFFTKSNQRDDFDGGYAWTDIYVSPLNKIEDSVKLASRSDIIAISNEGRYLLVKRIGDLQNSPAAIIDLTTKSYQLLLGRDYSHVKAFYSYYLRKFAFDFEKRIVYVDFPKQFPFNALETTNSKIPKWSNRKFYTGFDHPLFDD